MENQKLSIIIPCKNEAERLPTTLAALIAYSEANPIIAEIIVVDDGSTDNTAISVEPLLRRPNIHLLRHPKNLGKGAAVRTGMLAATSELVLFTDADLSAPITEIEKLLTSVLGGADIAIGSRALFESRIDTHQPRYREAIGRFGNVLIRSVLNLPFRDTQCGFKLFRREIGQVLFSNLVLTGWSFDYEVLLRAQERGYHVTEVPVLWTHVDQSKFRPLIDTYRCFVDLLWLRLNLKK